MIKTHMNDRVNHTVFYDKKLLTFLMEHIEKLYIIQNDRAFKRN